MGALKASISQPKLVENFRLALKTLGRFLVHGILEEFLSGGGIVREDASGEGELCEMFT